jgi:heme/copper-type cytochrome/quinol oxidase subunit 1
MASQLLNGKNGPALRVALVHLYEGFILFLLMGLLGLAMRLNHAQMLPLSPALYDELFTLHGSGMIAAILLGAMGGIIAVLSSRMHLESATHHTPNPRATNRVLLAMARTYGGITRALAWPFVFSGGRVSNGHSLP